MRHALLAIVCTAALAGCTAQRDRAELWRDASGQGRHETELSSDTAQCDYEVSRAQAGILPTEGPAMNRLAGAVFSGPNPRGLFLKCMSARGWSFVGYD